MEEEVSLSSNSEGEEEIESTEEELIEPKPLKEKPAELLPPPEPIKRKRTDEAGEAFKRRRLMREYKMIRVRHPDIDPSKMSKMDEELRMMETEEIEQHMENIRIEIGGVVPFATGTAILSGVGYGMERFLGMPGFKNQLLKSTQCLAAAECACPINLSDYGPYIQSLACISSEVSKYYDPPWTGNPAST